MLLAGPPKFIQESVVSFLILFGNTYGVDVICLDIYTQSMERTSTIRHTETLNLS